MVSDSKQIELSGFLRRDRSAIAAQETFRPPRSQEDVEAGAWSMMAKGLTDGANLLTSRREEIEWASALCRRPPLSGGGRAGSVNKTTGEVKTFKTYTKQTGGSSS